MPLSFPSSPTSGQTSVQNGRTYTWNGSNAWELTGNVPGHGSSHGASGSDPVTIASSQVTGLAAVATSGSASDLSAGTLADARLSGNVITAAILSASANASTSAIDTCDRRYVGSLSNMSSGVALFSFFSPTVSATATQVTVVNNIAGTNMTLVRVGLYTADSSGAITLVARTASDTTIFATTGGTFTRAFATTGGYPSSYSLVAGSRYAMGVVVVHSGTTPTVASNNSQNAVVALSPRIGARLESQTDLPTSVASGGYSTTSQNTYPWFRLS